MYKTNTQEKCSAFLHSESPTTAFWRVATLSALALLLSSASALANVTVTTASNGSSISADTAGGAFTKLSGPQVAEGAVGDIGTGNIVFTAPSGFEFDVTTTPVAVVTAGAGSSSKNINSTTVGSSFSATGITTTTITFGITSASGGGGSSPNTLVFSNIMVRPTAGTPLASGNITTNGTTSHMLGFGSTQTWGPLAEVVGALAQVSFIQQPTTAAVGATISPAVTVRTQDQFGNTYSTNSTVTIAIGTNPGGGTLGGTTSAAASSGTATFSTLNINHSGTGYTLTASSTGLTGDTSSTFNITNGNTTTTVASGTNPSTYGQSVTFTATVAAKSPATGTPTGTVTFKDNGTPLTTNTLSSGSVTFATSALTVGSHTITAVYNGDSNYNSSTNTTTLTQTVNQTSSTNTVTSTSSTSVSGQSITLTATITATGTATATGTVTFKDGGTTLGTGNLSGNQATFTTSSLSVAVHSITANYPGDANVKGSTNSPAFSQTVNKANSTMAVGSSANPSVSGQAVTYTATVSAISPGSGTPTGTVTFKDSGTTIGAGTLSSGQATFATNYAHVGSHSITAEYTGDSSFFGSTNATALTQTVNPANTTTVLSGSLPSTYGQSTFLTVTVGASSPGSGSPTGTLTYKDNGTPIATNAIGVPFSTGGLAAGSHSITVVYNGSSDFNTSTSSALAGTINQSSSTNTVTSTTNPSVSGQSVTLTATITATGTATATGTVTFKDGATTLGTGALSGNQATFATSSLSVASHSITAEYAGDSNVKGSTNSPAFTQTVNKASTTMGVTSGTNPSVNGQSVTYTATITVTSPGSGTATGSVTFKDGATTLGTGTLSGNVATLSNGSLSVGSHSVTAEYVGDGNFGGSTNSPALSQVVNKADTTTSVSPSINPTVFGQSVTFTATVSATAPGSGTPSGTVTFKDGATTLGTGTLSAGQATYSTSSLSVASHSITAVYGSDSSFNTSTSSAFSQVVNKADTTTSVSPSVNPSVAGQSVTFTATVSATSPGTGTPSGTVTFKDGATTLGTGTLSAGQATYSTSSLSVGSHSITAVYGSDSSFNGSTSSTLSQTVNNADTTTALTSGTNPSTYQQSVTFTATVSVTSPGTGTATGTVTFKEGATTLGTGTLSSGQATFSTSSLSVGSHSITAVYGGDSSFNGSTSSAVSQTVNTATPTVTVSSSVNPSIVNQSVSFSAAVPAVGGGVIPTGTVQFKIDGVNFGSVVALSSGSAASGSISTLTQGDHTITAEYSGDGNYTPTTNTLTQTVTAPIATCTASNNGPVCTGNTLQLFGTTTDTGSDVYYSWTGPNGFTSTNQNPTISNVTSDNAGTYWLTTGKTGTTNCIESTVVSVAPTLTASASADTVCTGASGNITANPSGGTAPYSYSWSPGGATTQAISVSDGGLYTVTVTDSTGTGCSVQASASLTLKPLPVVAISGASTVCPNSTNTFSGTAGMSSYAWSVSGAATIDGASNAQTVSVIAVAGCNTNFSLTLNVVSNGCANGTSTNVNVVDTTAPSITSVPADTTVSCANSVPAANDSAVVATDDCSSVTVTHLADVVTSSNCPNNFVITRSYVATDACGNSSSASQTITVHDTTGPVITGFPADATYSCSSAVPSADDGSVTTSDACGGTVTVTHADDAVTPGSCANRYTIARTYTATDACGNSTSQTQNITVSDDTAPVLAGVPSDVTVQCDAVPSAATPTATDNCDSNPTISFNQSTTAGSCPANYTITRVWTATDSCGNSSSGTQVITVVDTAPPVLAGVPADVTAQCDSVPAAASPTATDNCDAHPTVSLSESTVAGSCAGSYVLTRTWTATDACGNHSSGSQHITVIDSTAPTIAGVPADTTVQCDAVPTAATPTATDNCDTNATISLVETRVDGSCSNSYTLTRTWTASDACGNTSSKSQVITVIDTGAPTIAGVPADTTVQCDAVPLAANATASDTCDSNPSISMNETRVDGSCANSYTLTRVWTATDACGNTSSATQTITVIDTTAPVLAGVPNDTTVQCDNVPAAATPTATDNCDSNPSISFNQTRVDGSCANSYTLTRVWTATDACGNTSSGTQVITVIDSTAPVLANVPADTTVQCDAVPSVGSPTATDNCDSNPSITFGQTSAAGSCAGSYVLTRTWTATDTCGNHSSASQHITVIDTTAPVLAGVPADATAQCDSVPAAATPTATDNCDNNPSISFNETRVDGSCVGSYTLTRTWTATDVCGNHSSASQHITVIDSTAPTIAGVPADTTVQCDAVPTAATPTATDNCDTNATISLVETRVDGSCSNSYTLTRTWTASDACGNTSSKSQVITVIDTGAPTISGVPADTTVQCDAVPIAANATATDTCDSHPSISLNETRVDGSCSNSYTLTRTWTATDACGNTSSATQTITVIDTTAPVLAGVPNDTTVQCSAVPPAATPTATDTCDSNPTVSFNETRTDGSCANSYMLTRVWTATDACGNSSSGTQIVTVIDTIAPVLAGVPVDVTAQCDSIPSVGSPTATDNCDSNPTISFGETSAAGSCAGSYVLTRTWTATDACGNHSSASQHITVIDTTAPVIGGVPADATVQCDAVPTAATATATDNCDTNATISLVETRADGSCSNSYTLTRTWTASDACGNTSSKSQVITVIDSTAPVIAGVPADATVQCDVVPVAATPTATDNCDTNATISLVETRVDGSCSNSYTLTRTWTASDACGNTSSKSQVIAVIDTGAPTIAGVPADTTVQCDAVPLAANATASDTCDSNPSISMNETRVDGSCANSYTLTRVWTATDACGNTSSTTQTITVHDTTAPVLSAAPSDVTVQCDSVPTASTLTATDNCDSSPSVTLDETISNGAVAGQFVITRTWTATDACGNTSTARQHITAIDTTAPTLSSVPSDATVECNAVPTAGSPTATDNCDPHPTVSLNETRVDGSCSNSYTLTRTWTATDASGNTSSATQTITVHDTTAPTLVGVPPDATVRCDAVPTAPALTANDNCDTNPVVSLSTSSTQTPTGAGHYNYSITNTWTATDVCGNSSSATQTITVQDTNAPTFTSVPQDTTAECSSVPSAGTPVVADNCDSNPTVSLNETSTQAGSGCGQFNYTITRTWTATDASGNSSTAQQIVTVHDTTGPVLSAAPPDTTAQCDNVPSAATLTATDNCDSAPTVSLNETRANGNCGGNYILTRTWTATDVCGNTSTKTQTVTVIDTTAPVLSAAPSDVTVQCDNIPGAATLTATDNCDSNPTVSMNQTTSQTPTGSGHYDYTITRTWTATDACGNHSSASQTITVHDTTAPILSAAPASVTVECNLVPTASTLTATDNCDPNPTVTMNETRVDGSCTNSYTLTRVWTATDAAGNTSTASQTVTVHDTTAPTLVGVPADATVQCSSVPPAATPTATDNCDANPTVSLSESSTQVPSGCGHYSYSITRTWTATDACGNSSSRTQTITVADTNAPTLVGVPPDTTAQCSSVPSAATVTATDNCDSNPSVSINETTTPGTNANNYTITRTWTATDACGNTKSGQQVITVIDSTAPILSGVPADTTAVCSSVPSAGSPTASDNCDTNATVTLSETSTQTPSGCGHNNYVITRTWTATDASGNTSTASQHVTVMSEAPTITGYPADATYSCSGLVPAANDTLVTATDSCGAAVTITHDADVITAQTCANRYTIARKYYATSACGDFVSHTQTITVNDTNAPTITGFPADATYTATNQVPAADDSLVTATDDCGGGVTISHSPDQKVDGVDSHHFTITRTYTATDACGNSSSQTQTFTLNTTTVIAIAITNKTDVVTNKSHWTFSGTASGENPIASVKYQLNGGALQTASGTTSWTTGPLTLVAGTNTFVAYAIDNQSNQSTNATAVVFWATSNIFKVVIQDWPHKGNSSSAKFTMVGVTGSPIGKKLKVGATYTITQLPGANRRFLGWAYGVDTNAPTSSTDATLTFLYDTNKVLVARYEDPFYYIKGNYTGLFAEKANLNPRSAGYIAFNVPAASDSSANKMTSTKLLLDGMKYRQTIATFDTNGYSQFTVSSSRSGLLTVDLYADLNSSFTGVITGTVACVNWTANVTMYRDNDKAALQAMGAARYTMVLPTTNTTGLAPVGWTDAAIHRLGGGSITMSGTLADSGKSWSPQVGKPSADGYFPLFAQLYKAGGVPSPDGILWGWLQFTNDQNGVIGTLYWSRPAGITSANGGGNVLTYPAGFTNQQPIVASPFNETAVPLNWTGDGTVFFYDGARPGETNKIQQLDSYTLKAEVNVQYPVTGSLYKLHISKTTGLVTGGFTDPNDKRTDSVNGVVLQNQAMAAGLFWRTNAGAFLLDQP